ncbi:hypothetical protein [Paludisphaera soli]|uniref:hypothetical protein n=1 Tax=Paludisphaera soli TaxID=2712865 RepID=UPI0013EB6854|nr:hypothetical protein [Paludisphaera soli]
MDVETLFQAELERRGIPFRADLENEGGYLVERDGAELAVSLHNLARELERDGDAGRVAAFVDAVERSWLAAEAGLAPEHLYWILEPSDYAESLKASYRNPLSPSVDVVLAFTDPEARLVSWATAEMLRALKLTEDQSGALASQNLARALEEATLQVEVVDGSRLGVLTTSLPFKTALMLAPNLPAVAGGPLGWPLLAVAPDRDFLYLWPASDHDLLARLGRVVVREYRSAPHPLSTEVWELSNDGIRAIGSFPAGPADG